MCPDSKVGVFPPRAILAAVDFSESSRTALEFAVRLARHTTSSLHVLHAEDPLLAAAARASGVDLSQESRDELTRLVHSVSPAASAQLQYHVATGPGAATICNVASHEEVDLIVVGMHGMSGPARAMFGSTTEGVLRHATASVLVVPRAWVPPAGGDLSGTGPVVVAVDLTEPALESAAEACRLAALLNTSVELVHVVPELPVLDRWRSHARDAMDRRLHDAQGELSGMQAALDVTVTVRTHVECGPIAQGIARAAHAHRHPLLVLGRRRCKSQLGAPGATAYRVLALAQVPVLVHLPEV